MICPKCGATNDDNAWKCVQCQTILQQAPPPAVSGPPVVIPNYLWQAIVCTVCCCLPLGIAAIVYAAQVNGKLAAGDYHGALATSNTARTWCWVAFACGVVWWVLTLLWFFAVVARRLSTNYLAAPSPVLCHPFGVA